jgi:hypothetical protein
MSTEPNTLLQRQAGLLEYLTSGGTIFGEGDLHADVFGVSRGLLHVEAKYSHQKRMEKIESVLATTLNLLGASWEAIVRAFAETCPPASLGRLDNARQFHAFLLAHWRERAPEPPCLPDIAAFEIAHATVQARQALPAEAAPVAPGGIRRHRAVALLRCAYDILPIFEGRAEEPPLEPRETLLAIAMPEGGKAPTVYALPRELFTLVELLDDFTDPEVFAEIPEADAIVGQLAGNGLVEVSR